MTETNSELAGIFLAFSRDRLMNRQWPRMKACVEPLTVEQVWWRPNEASNTIGNLLLHLNGNIMTIPSGIACVFEQSQDGYKIVDYHDDGDEGAHLASVSYTHLYHNTIIQ